jgi:hypothetical protein
MVSGLKWLCRPIPYLITVPARGGKGGLKQFMRGGRNRRLRYTFGRATKSSYTTEVVIVRREWPGKGVRYFAYAVYRPGHTDLDQVYEAYRRRFSIESGYRQSHQVRARTSSRHPGLRLLLFGLSLALPQRPGAGFSRLRSDHGVRLPLALARPDPGATGTSTRSKHYRSTRFTSDRAGL